MDILIVVPGFAGCPVLRVPAFLTTLEEIQSFDQAMTLPANADMLTPIGIGEHASLLGYVAQYKTLRKPLQISRAQSTSQNLITIVLCSELSIDGGTHQLYGGSLPSSNLRPSGILSDIHDIRGCIDDELLATPFIALRRAKWVAGDVGKTDNLVVGDRVGAAMQFKSIVKDLAEEIENYVKKPDQRLFEDNVFIAARCGDTTQALLISGTQVTPSELCSHFGK